MFIFFNEQPRAPLLSDSRPIKCAPRREVTRRTAAIWPALPAPLQQPADRRALATTKSHAQINVQLKVSAPVHRREQAEHSCARQLEVDHWQGN